ncbi:MAG: type II secretion system F family protein [Gemmatimonadaceae bacterium]
MRKPSGPTRRVGSRRAVLDFSLALGSLLEAGLPLAVALRTAATSAQLSDDIEKDLSGRLARGESLASALASYPELFSRTYIGVVRAGEQSAALGPAFRRLASQLERDDQLRAKALSAMLYPAILAGAAIVSMIVLVLFVLPRFAELLDTTGGSLPATTTALLAISSAAQRHWYGLPIAAALGVLLISWLRHSDAGRRWWSGVALQLPLIGPLRRMALTARVARLNGTLLSGGASLLGALDDVASSLDDPLGADELARIRGRVREGASLAATFQESALFSPILAQLVAVGEGAGRVPEFLHKAADLFDERVDRARQRMLLLVEPAMIVIFGGVIGFVALSLLQAVYGLNEGALR